MSVYVINLERNPDRLDFISKRLKKIEINFKRVDAVDGNALSEDFIESFREQSKRPTGWKLGQIGCFLSHRKVWETIVEDDEKYAVVLEDDLHISDSISSMLVDLNWIPEDADVIRLENTTNWVKLEKVGEVHERDICSLGSDSWCTGAYIISRNAAKFLLEQDQSLWLPSDTYMFSKTLSKVARELTVYQINPSLVCQDKYKESVDGVDECMNFGSEIEGASDVDGVQINFKQRVKNFLAPFLGYKRSTFKE